MGKKKNKSFYKNNVKPFVADNKVLLAVLGGIAAGISIAGILGTEKAQQIVGSIGDTAKDYTQKIKETLTAEGTPETTESKTRRRPSAVETI